MRVWIGCRMLWGLSRGVEEEKGGGGGRGRGG